MEWLVVYLKQVIPDSVIVIVKEPANKNVDLTGVNRSYKALAHKLGVVYASISKGYDIHNPKHYRDGSHPLPAGQLILMNNLKKAIKQYL
jgi:hypothetical protein